MFACFNQRFQLAKDGRPVAGHTALTDGGGIDVVVDSDREAVAGCQGVPASSWVSKHHIANLCGIRAGRDDYKCRVASQGGAAGYRNAVHRKRGVICNGGQRQLFVCTARRNGNCRVGFDAAFKPGEHAGPI